MTHEEWGLWKEEKWDDGGGGYGKVVGVSECEINGEAVQVFHRQFWNARMIDDDKRFCMLRAKYSHPANYDGIKLSYLPFFANLMAIQWYRQEMPVVTSLSSGATP